MGLRGNVGLVVPLVVAVGALVVAVVLSVTAEEAPPASGEQVVALEDVDDLDDLAAIVGRRVEAHGVRVLSVPADEGFWVDGGSGRVWIQITTAWESRAVVQPGDRAAFTGRVVSHGPNFADRPEFSSSEAEALVDAGAHIEVDINDLRVDMDG